MSIKATVPMASAVSLRCRLQTGIAFNLVAALFNQGSTFAFNIVAANFLGRQAYGEYTMVQSTLLALSQVAQLACGYTATRYIAEFRSTDKEKTGRIIGVLLQTIWVSAGIVTLAMLACVPWLAGTILRRSELKIPLAIGAAVVFFSVVNGFFIGALAGFEAYRKLARALGTSGVFYFSACTAFAWRAGLEGAVAGLFFSALVQWVLLARALKSESAEQGIQIRYQGFREQRSVLVGFALPAAMSGLTSMPALWLGSAILVRRPEGYLQMALFSAAYTLMSAVLFMPNIANSVGMSVLNHHKGLGRLDDYRRTFWMNLAIVAVIVLLGASTLSFLGPEILRLFGKSFQEGYSVLLIMMAATIPQGLALSAWQLIQSQERMWLSFFAIALPRDSMLVALACLLIPRYGAPGLASAYMAAWIIALVSVVSIGHRIGFQTAPAVKCQSL